MNYPTHDTNWAISAKGNTWRRLNGIPLIVGKRKDGKWWARRGDEFVTGSFETEEQAKNAAEFGRSIKDFPVAEDEWEDD